MERAKPRGPRPLGEEIRAFLRESGLGLGPLEARVLRAWEQAIEPELRARAVPMRFRQGTLTVEVRSAPLLQELRSFRGEELRARVNATFAEPPLRRIVFKTGT